MKLRYLTAFVAALLLAAGADGKERLSVLYFKNASGQAEYDWMAKGLADMLITDLARFGELEIVEREELQKILEEQELGLSAAFDEEKSVEVGKLLQASALALGHFAVAGGRLRIDVKIEGVEDGAVKSAVSVEGTPEGVFELERALADKVAAGFGLAPAPASDPAAAQGTASVAAIAQYYKGIALKDEKKFDDAAVCFKASLAADPSFKKSELSLEESYRFLGKMIEYRQSKEIRELERKAAEALAALGERPYRPERLGKTEIGAWTEAVDCIEELSDLDNPLLDAEKKRSYARKALFYADRALDLFGDTAEAVPIAYSRLILLRDGGNWLRLKAECERFLKRYPDYRMTEAVERMYGEALERLGPAAATARGARRS